MPLTQSAPVLAAGSAIADEEKAKVVWMRGRTQLVEQQTPGVTPYSTKSQTAAFRFLGEIYELSDAQHEHLLASEPPDLYEAPIVLEDGSTVNAMLYPRTLIVKHQFPDISHYGAWAAYKNANPTGTPYSLGINRA